MLVEMAILMGIFSSIVDMFKRKLFTHYYSRVKQLA